MSATQPDARWFVLPIVSPAGTRRPKYTDRDGITGFAGVDVDFDNAAWADFPIELPMTGERYVARLYGEGDALDGVEAESDVQTMATLGLSRDAVATLLNTHFDTDRTFDEWATAVGVGVNG